MSKKKFVIGTVCCIGVLSIGLECTNSYNIKQEKQEQIRIEKIKKEKEHERIKKEKEQERIAREKEEKEKEELRRKQEEEEKRKAEELKAAQEAERLAAEQAAQQAAQAQQEVEQAALQAIVEENNVQENYVSEEVVQNNEYAVAANTQSSVSYEDFMVMGVVYSNGYKYTYYSQSVLPGGGLNIPGRYVSGGFVRDGNGYIVLANDAPKGTIIETPFGTGMVYDRGTYGSHIDVYVQ